MPHTCNQREIACTQHTLSMQSECNQVHA
jgi:hypothetical protein